MTVNGRKVVIAWGVWWLSLWAPLHYARLACRVWWGGEPEAARAVVKMMRRNIKAMRLVPYLIIASKVAPPEARPSR